MLDSLKKIMKESFAIKEEEPNQDHLETSDVEQQDFESFKGYVDKVKNMGIDRDSSLKSIKNKFGKKLQKQEYKDYIIQTFPPKDTKAKIPELSPEDEKMLNTLKDEGYDENEIVKRYMSAKNIKSAQKLPKSVENYIRLMFPKDDTKFKVSDRTVDIIKQLKAKGNSREQVERNLDDLGIKISKSVQDVLDKAFDTSHLPKEIESEVDQNYDHLGQLVKSLNKREKWVLEKEIQKFVKSPEFIKNIFLDSFELLHKQNKQKMKEGHILKPENVQELHDLLIYQNPKNPGVFKSSQKLFNSLSDEEKETFINLLELRIIKHLKEKGSDEVKQMLNLKDVDDKGQYEKKYVDTIKEMNSKKSEIIRKAVDILKLDTSISLSEGRYKNIEKILSEKFLVEKDEEGTKGPVLPGHYVSIRSKREVGTDEKALNILTQIKDQMDVLEAGGEENGNKYLELQRQSEKIRQELSTYFPVGRVVEYDPSKNMVKILAYRISEEEGARSRAKKGVGIGNKRRGGNTFKKTKEIIERLESDVEIIPPSKILTLKAQAQQAGMNKIQSTVSGLKKAIKGIAKTGAGILGGVAAFNALMGGDHTEGWKE